jgi:hypothetical protein
MFFVDCRWNPDKRPTAQQALKYSYFKSMTMTPNTDAQNMSLIEQTKKARLRRDAELFVRH